MQKQHTHTYTHTHMNRQKEKVNNKSAKQILLALETTTMHEQQCQTNDRASAVFNFALWQCCCCVVGDLQQNAAPEEDDDNNDDCGDGNGDGGGSGVDEADDSEKRNVQLLSATSCI